VTNWQRIGDRALRTLRLNSMSGKFLLFTVLATLFTTLAMALLLSGGNGRSVGDRVDLELRSVSSEVARAMGAWVDQHVFDLRLRASPYVVSDNLARASGGGRPPEPAGSRGAGDRRSRRSGPDEQRQPNRLPTLARPAEQPADTRCARGRGILGCRREQTGDRARRADPAR